MKPLYKILLFTLPVIAAMSFLIPFDAIWNFMKDYSADGEIKPGTRTFYQDLFFKGRTALLVISFLPSIYYYFFDHISKIINKLVTFVVKKITSTAGYFSTNAIFISALVVSIIFIISAVFLFDIGQDPSYYLNDFQNIEKYGFIARDYDPGGVNIYLIPNLPFNILGYVYVKLFGFSVIGIRFIIVLFTLLFIYSIYLFLDRETFKYSYILIFSIPGIYSLTSEIFLEIAALAFIFFALFYLNKFESQLKKKFEYYSIIFFALAFSIKFQLLAYLFLVFLALFLFESDSARKKFLLFFLIKTYALIFFIVIATVLPFGFDETLVYLNWYFISAGAEGRSFLSNTDLKLFMVNEILFIPLLILTIYLYYKFSGGAKKTYSFNIIAVFTIINVLYWLLLFYSVTWRNIIYACVFTCIMLAAVLIRNKNYAKVALFSFLLFGILSNFIFIHHGVIDDVQFLKERYKAIVFAKDNSQKSFFAEAGKIIESEANVYVPALPYLARVYLDNRRVILLEDFEHTKDKKSYLIFDKDAFGDKEFLKLKEKEFAGDYKNVLSVGDYHLFEIYNK